MVVAYVRRVVWLRYVLASALALGLDFALFLAAMQAGAPAFAASAIGYGGGIVAHWLISTRAVFVGRLASSETGRQRQRALFVASAFVGLGITVAIVGLGEAAGLDPRLAKLAAIGVAFQTTYWLRRRIVFA